MKQIQTELLESVMVARIGNLPGGYMNDQTATELVALLDQLDDLPSVRCVIFTGAEDGVFIRHFDVQVLEERGRKMAEKGFTFDCSRPVPETPYLQALRRIELSPLPFIAALNGTAMGGGFELALACDFRLAQDGPYQIGLPEINIGLLPGAGGTQRLTRLLGQARALELIMTGTVLSPRRAAEYGLLMRCTDGPVLPEAMQLAKTLAAKPPRAMAHIKQLINGANEQPLEQGLADERTLFCDLMVDEHSIELMRRMNSGEIVITGE